MDEIIRCINRTLESRVIMTEINKPDMKITPHVANKNVQPDVKIEKLSILRKLLAVL